MRTLMIVVLVLAVCNLLGLALVARRVSRLDRPPVTEWGGPAATRPGHPEAGRMHGRFGRGGPEERDPDAVPGWLSPEQRQQIMSVLAKYDPEIREAMNRPGGPGPFFRHRLMRNWQAVLELVEADKTDPELAGELADSLRQGRELSRVAAEHRRAPEAQKPELRQKLRDMLAQQFELRQWIRQRRLEQLAKQIDKLRQELTQRQTDRDVLIDRELTRRAESQPEELPEW